jgi:hypothetical protein
MIHNTFNSSSQKNNRALSSSSHSWNKSREKTIMIKDYNNTSIAIPIVVLWMINQTNRSASIHIRIPRLSLTTISNTIKIISIYVINNTKRLAMICVSLILTLTIWVIEIWILAYKNRKRWSNLEWDVRKLNQALALQACNLLSRLHQQPLHPIARVNCKETLVK